jgi:hypothetical protein
MDRGANCNAALGRFAALSAVHSALAPFRRAWLQFAPESPAARLR